MKVLAVDPGAERCGWAVLREDGPERVASGIVSFPRGDDENYQPYKVRLIESWVKRGTELLNDWTPDCLVVEIVPAVGGGNFVAAAQSHLAATVATVLLSLSVKEGKPIHQLSANKVKRQIGGVKDATKPKVRDGVYRVFPEFEVAYRAQEQRPKKPVWDELDALAIGLTHLGVNPHEGDKN